MNVVLDQEHFKEKKDFKMKDGGLKHRVKITESNPGLLKQFLHLTFAIANFYPLCNSRNLGLFGHFIKFCHILAIFFNSEKSEDIYIVFAVQCL